MSDTEWCKNENTWCGDDEYGQMEEIGDIEQVFMIGLMI